MRWNIYPRLIGNFASKIRRPGPSTAGLCVHIAIAKLIT